jgi:predicted phage baseplate assembly protein
MAPPDGSTIDVTYRVGVGRGGNAGSDSLAHVVVPDPTPPNWPDVDGVRNPLPAWGGLDPESLDQVKRMAPAAFHSELYRAVTEDDFARAAEKLPEVQRAAARFRWTGSWYTVFVAVDPAGTDELTPDLGGRIAAFLTRYRQAGYDLEITPPVYVPLEVAVEVCVAADHFRGDVKRAVLEALDATVHPDGGLGFFAPDNFTFGQSVYLSRLYAALESIPGVDSARVAVFKRFGMVPAGELDAGRIEMAPLEIARLDNDPSAPENGTLTLSMLGGK